MPIVTTAAPKRVSARLELTLEDIAAVGQANFESILRENLSPALSDELDKQAINGDGTATGIWKLEDQVIIGEHDLTLRGAAFYYDEYVKTDAGWRIKTTGYRRIFEEMRLAGLADPGYVQTAGSVRLTLSSAVVDRALEERLPRAARGVLRLIREAGRLSTGEAAEATGSSRPAVLRQLRSLEREGLIEWVGKSKNDPRAYWRLRVD